MKRRNLLLTSLLTIAVVGLFGAVLATSVAPTTARATGLVAMRDHGSHARRGDHCHEIDDTRLRLAAAYASIVLDLNDAQEAALEPVLDVVRRWHDEAAAYCDPAGLDTAPALIRSAAALVERTSLAIDDLVPAFDAFYATLTAEQQERLNDWIRAHHGHRV